MRASMPFSSFVLLIGILNLTFLIIFLFFEEPFEYDYVLIIITAIGSLIFIPLGIKYMKEDYDRR